MDCPYCHKNIEIVIGEGKCTQKVSIDEEGNPTDFSDTTVEGEDYKYFCFLCDEDITHLIKEIDSHD